MVVERAMQQLVTIEGHISTVGCYGGTIRQLVAMGNGMGQLGYYGPGDYTSHVDV